MKTLKIVALGYVVKTLLVGVAWIFIPDLPSRTMTVARRAWAWFETPAPAPASVAAPPSQASAVTRSE
jgi:hypothetical protein